MGTEQMETEYFRWVCMLLNTGSLLFALPSTLMCMKSSEDNTHKKKNTLFFFLFQNVDLCSLGKVETLCLTSGGRSGWVKMLFLTPLNDFRGHEWTFTRLFRWEHPSVYPLKAAFTNIGIRINDYRNRKKKLAAHYLIPIFPHRHRIRCWRGKERKN